MYENYTLEELQMAVDVRVNKLTDADAVESIEAYLDGFYDDAASLIELLEDFDKGIYK